MNWTEAHQLGDLEALEEHFQELDQYIQDQAMTNDKELVKRLRASRAVWENGRSHPTDDEAEAADRIEALTAERDEAMQLLQTLSNMNGDLSRDMYKTKLLLAKAVELGDKMAKSIEGNYYTPGLVGEWRALLAEIEGEKT
jgi:hypothetical protein